MHVHQICMPVTKPMLGHIGRHAAERAEPKVIVRPVTAVSLHIGIAWSVEKVRRIDQQQIKTLSP